MRSLRILIAITMACVSRAGYFGLVFSTIIGDSPTRLDGDVSPSVSIPAHYTSAADGNRRLAAARCLSVLGDCNVGQPIMAAAAFRGGSAVDPK
jgi:hypothetical protein